MAEVAAGRPSGTGAAPRAALFALAVFLSAALVFTVQPMIARLVLPKLGGSPAVWNTSMVFFQAALLLGYAYAHALQRLSLRRQFLVHIALLALAALFLPLRLTGLIGDPPPDAPAAWLIGALALSVGAPFAVLSATAPLMQAWWARTRGEQGGDPYVLYAASNLGSFAALLAYPALLEPLMKLQTQTAVWSVGYGLFALALLALAFNGRAAPDQRVAAKPTSAPPSWREKLIWIALAAAPSSLMLGVTSFLSTDVASVPLLWVVPLALYLLTFVIAFSTRPAIPFRWTLLVHGVIVCTCTVMLPFGTAEWGAIGLLHLVTFFFSALLCHQNLAQRRPPADRLTEFYLMLSVGGVLGGAFTALVAPVVFDVVREYPLVLLLVGLARPWGKGRVSPMKLAVFGAAVFGGLVPIVLYRLLNTFGQLHDVLSWNEAKWIGIVAVGFGGALTILLRDRALLFVGALAVISVGAHAIGGNQRWLESERSFFGVMRVSESRYDQVGAVKVLMHGTTIHGAQAGDPRWICHPMMYYAPSTPLGQAVATVQARGRDRTVGVVGLGTGALASYKRASDRWRYFEIDPEIVRLARNERYFSYLTKCANGPVDVVLGDARLTLEREREGTYDLLVIDAFSSDAVPVHLLTREAIAGYLRLLKPDGVVVLHLSNRNLEITSPAVATAASLGAPALWQVYYENEKAPSLTEASTEALVIGKTPAALADFALDPRWSRPAPAPEGRTWTDDYVNVVGAVWRDCCAKKGD